MTIEVNATLTKAEVERILKAYIKDSYVIKDGATYKVTPVSDAFSTRSPVVPIPDYINISVIFEDSPPEEMNV